MRGAEIMRATVIRIKRMVSIVCCIIVRSNRDLKHDISSKEFFIFRKLSSLKDKEKRLI